MNIEFPDLAMWAALMPKIETQKMLKRQKDRKFLNREEYQRALKELDEIYNSLHNK